MLISHRSQEDEKATKGICISLPIPHFRAFENFSVLYHISVLYYITVKCDLERLNSKKAEGPAITIDPPAAPVS